MEAVEWLKVGSGYGDGSGYGSGYGDGSGDGFGYGSGDGFGDGYGDGLKTFNSMDVHIIDGVQTIITHIRGNVAKGFILNSDFTLTPCYVVKSGNYFAHGKTLKEAQTSLDEKLFQDLSEEERIASFNAMFPDVNSKVKASTLSEWHHKLTGSCSFGREQFMRERGIKDDDELTVKEFIEITKDAYGGSIINRIFIDD